MTVAGSVFPFLEADDAERRAAAIEALTLDGKRFDAKVADAIQDIPFERDISGQSTVSLLLIDPEGDLLDSGLFSASVDIELPLPGLSAASGRGLPLPRGEMVGYRLSRITGGLPLLTLEFRERIIAYLMQHDSVIKANRANTTRAEFIRRMVREVKAEQIRFWSPELHTTQPIGKRRQLATPKQKKQTRQPGFGSSTPTVKDKDATRNQIRLLEAALETATSLKVGDKVKVGLVEAMTQESGINNDRGNSVGASPAVGTTGAIFIGGHMENVGVLHQDARYWPASRDVPKDVTPFINRLKTAIKANPGKSIGWCVDSVQRSYSINTAKQGKDYDQWEAEARATVAAYTGDDGLTAGNPLPSTYTQRFWFRRGEPGQGKSEDSWVASGRLASEVQFRRFVDLGVFHYVSDDYLIRSASRLTLLRTNLPAGIASVSISDFDVAKPQATVRVQAYVDVLEPVIGSVWMLSGYGPVDGRYLVTNVKGSYLKPICTVTLSLPVPKLPEPAPETGTRATPADPVANRSLQGTSVANAYDAAHAIDKKRYPYVWGGGHRHAGTPDTGTGRDPGIGYDCSGSTAAVLQAGGMLPKEWVNGVPASGTFAAQWGLPGEGQHLTVWANSTHVFIEFKGMTNANKTEHFGTGNWGKGWNGPGFNPNLHPHAGFTPRHWDAAFPHARPVMPTNAVGKVLPT
jgi:hypothetical protein